MNILQKGTLSMTNVQHEDAIMKMGFDYFKGTLLKRLGIHESFVDAGPTELVTLTIQSLPGWP